MTNIKQLKLLLTRRKYWVDLKRTAKKKWSTLKGKGTSIYPHVVKLSAI